MLVLFLLCGLLATAAGPAFASDTTVERAWKAGSRDLDKLDKPTGRAYGVYVHSKGRTAGPFSRAVNKILKLSRRWGRAVRREESSSKTGASARSSALRSIRDLKSSWTLMKKSVKALARAYRSGRASDVNEAFRAVKTAGRVVKRSERYAKRADRLFAKARKEAEAEKQQPAPAP
jgi:hypothetical protein